MCRESKGEKATRTCLEFLGIKFTEQQKFDGCKRIYSLMFDFYVDDKFLIEYDGVFHHEPIKNLVKKII